MYTQSTHHMIKMTKSTSYVTERKFEGYFVVIRALILLDKLLCNQGFHQKCLIGGVHEGKRIGWSGGEKELEFQILVLKMAYLN